MIDWNVWGAFLAGCVVGGFIGHFVGSFRQAVQSDKEKACEELRQEMEQKRKGASAYLTPGRCMITRAAFLEKLKGRKELLVIEEWLRRPDCLGVAWRGLREIDSMW
jgi:hypothetical protein